MDKLVFIIAFGATFFFSSCTKDDDGFGNHTSNSANKIMPLGASRVEGNSPNFESYRYELWKLLIVERWDFDYIGTQEDPNKDQGIFDLNFDLDHEGWSGYTSGEILENLPNWLSEAGSPDIVLFSSPGGNDALQGLSYTDALTNVNGIIDELQRVNPEVTIIIEQLAPARSDAMTPALTNYFNQMQQDVLDIAVQQTTGSSSVITVDMATGFTDSLFADPVHYNQAGAEFVANRYYAVLKDILK
jgi:hypothetical protein